MKTRKLVQFVHSERFPSEEEIRDFLSDVKTTHHHEKLINNALEVAKEIPQIEAVFLFGSLSKGEGDLFSDIDFYVLFKDKEEEEIIKEQFLDQIDRVGEAIHLFYSTFNMKDFIIYFKPFIKFEFGLKLYDDLCKSWTLTTAKLLYDRNGWGSKAIEESLKIKFNMQDHTMFLQNVAIAFPSFCYIVAGFIIRGEHITALYSCDWVREYILRASQLILGIYDEGPRRAEQRLPAEVVDMVKRTQVKQIDDIWFALVTFLTWYEEWFIPRADKLNLQNASNETQRIHLMLKLLREKI
ncbi:MAG: nucleotidyltransferase domain-containing protein [Candidatus Kariarchaeaceae archaeon]|jgi:predicted nucleotidyltransferase